MVATIDHFLVLSHPFSGPQGGGKRKVSFLFLRACCGKKSLKGYAPEALPSSSSFSFPLTFPMTNTRGSECTRDRTVFLRFSIGSKKGKEEANLVRDAFLFPPLSFYSVKEKKGICSKRIYNKTRIFLPLSLSGDKRL